MCYHYQGDESDFIANCRLREMVSSVSSIALSRLTLEAPWTVAHQAPLPWNFPGKNIGVGSHFLPQGILLTQGSNSHFLHSRQILHH